MSPIAESGVVRAGVLDVAFERHGPAGGWPVVLLHGFPQDTRCYDRVAPALADAGADVVVPYLRGYGGTRFVSAATVRSGQQAAREWSPTWDFSDAEFSATQPSFDNPDFVDVVVHSYRHRFGLVAGDPAYQATEQAIAAQPRITVPTVVLDPTDDYLHAPKPRAEHERHFSNLVQLRTVEAGHNLPQERPDEFAAAVLDLHSQV